MSHTPAPWTWVPADEMIVGSDDEVVVYELNTSAADAQLISAAPDLLAGCKAALGAFENNSAINWDDLRRAIEKAEGTPPEGNS